jgi:hypothetical protein
MVDVPAVRVATTDDVDAVMELAIMGSRENSFVPADPAKLLFDVWGALTLEHGICGAIGPKGGPLEAAVLIKVGPTWYSNASVLEERAIFVHPKYRGALGGRASRLMTWAKTVSDRMAMPLLIGVLSNERTEAKVRAYRRHFGEPAGAFWLYNAKTGGGTVVGDAVTHAPGPPAGQ